MSSRIATLAIVLLAIIAAGVLFVSASRRTWAIASDAPAPSREILIEINFSSVTSPHVLDAILVALETTIGDMDDIQRMTYAIGFDEFSPYVPVDPENPSPPGHGTDSALLVAEVKVGVDSLVARSRMEERTQRLNVRVSSLLKSERITIKSPTEPRLLYITMNVPNDFSDVSSFYSHRLKDILSAFARLPGIDRATFLGSPTRDIHMSLDLDRMKSIGVTRRNILQTLETPDLILGELRRGFAQSEAVARPDDIHLPPQRSIRQYEDIIIKATPAGEIIRLKDVATFNRIPRYPSHGGIARTEAGRSSPIIVLGLRPEARIASVKPDLQKILKELTASLKDEKATFEISESLPSSIEPLTDRK